MRDEKKEAYQQGQTNEEKQHSTPKAVTFPKKMSYLGWDSNQKHSRQSILPLSYMYVHVDVNVHCNSHSLHVDSP